MAEVIQNPLGSKEALKDMDLFNKGITHEFRIPFLSRQDPAYNRVLTDLNKKYPNEIVLDMSNGIAVIRPSEIILTALIIGHEKKHGSWTSGPEMMFNNFLSGPEMKKFESVVLYDPKLLSQAVEKICKATGLKVKITILEEVKSSEKELSPYTITIEKR